MLQQRLACMKIWNNSAHPAALTAMVEKLLIGLWHQVSSIQIFFLQIISHLVSHHNSVSQMYCKEDARNITIELMWIMTVWSWWGHPQKIRKIQHFHCLVTITTILIFTICNFIVFQILIKIQNVSQVDSRQTYMLTGWVTSIDCLSVLYSCTLLLLGTHVHSTVHYIHYTTA